MTVQPLEHFLVASPDVLPLRHHFCRPGPRKWRSTPRDVAIFSLSFFFFGWAKNLGICKTTSDRSSASSRNREKKEHLGELQSGTDFLWQCDVIGLQLIRCVDVSASSPSSAHHRVQFEQKYRWIQEHSDIKSCLCCFICDSPTQNVFAVDSCPAGFNTSRTTSWLSELEMKEQWSVDFWSSHHVMSVN